MIPSQLPLFLTVARSGSFAAAARKLGISAPAVSKSILTLEEQMQIRLFHRSTRSVTLTDQGQKLFEKTEHLYEELDFQVREFIGSDQIHSGKIRINLPHSFGEQAVLPKILEFAKQHPSLELELSFDDRVVGLIEEGFDIGIGTQVNPDSRMVGRPLYTLREVAVCSPSYLKKYKTVDGIDCLANHHCIAYRSPTSGRIRPWKFKDGVGKHVSFSPVGNLTVSTPTAALQAAVAGLGVIVIGHWHVQQALQQGLLTQVLEQYEPNSVPLWIYYPTRRLQPAGTKLFVDFLVDSFSAED